MKKFWSARTLTEVALSAALLVVCSLISVPAAVPFTLQTFGVFCALNLLGLSIGGAFTASSLHPGLAQPLALA